MNVHITVKLPNLIVKLIEYQNLKSLTVILIPITEPSYVVIKSIIYNSFQLITQLFLLLQHKGIILSS